MVPAGSRRQCLAQDQCRHDKGKTVREGTPRPRKKRADLQLVKEHGQQEGRTCEDWLRQEDREPTNGERHTRAMMCIRWKNNFKFLTAEALRGVTIFDAQGAELGKRDYVTGTALEQG